MSTSTASGAAAAAVATAAAAMPSPSKTKAKNKAASALNSTSGVLDYLRTVLPRSTLLQLYTEESRGRFVCRAILQQISGTAQQVVIRLSCTGGCFSWTGIKVWTKCNVRDAFESQALESILLEELEKWAIIEPMSKQRAVAAAESSPVLVRLTDEFQIGLRASMSCLEASPWTAIPPEQLALLLSQQPPPSTSSLLQQKRSRSPTPPQKRVRAALNSNNNKQTSSSSSSSSSAPQSQSQLLQDQNTPMTPEDLERYTQDVWDAVLHFLVGTVGTTEPPKAVVHFLLQTGLMQLDPDEINNSSSAGAGSKLKSNSSNNKYDDSSPLVITEKGYDFMLQDNHEQVWHFVVQYLNVISTSAATREKGQKKVREALLLLICLSFCRVGQAYPASSLTKSGRRMLRDLAHFGLLYVRDLVVSAPEGDAAAATAAAGDEAAATADAPNSATIFYPTRVATQLLGSTNASSSGGGSHDNGADDVDTMPAVAGGNVWSLSSKALNIALAQPDPRGSSHLAIIVQTNFQVCAYTTSELHISMLGLFCDVQTIRRLPNVVFMVMTRNSVKSAFAFGIKARQILRFLEKHAHPKLRDPNNNIGGGTNTGSPLPSNVVDQVWLWDRERTRVTFTEVAVHLCLMPGEFGAVLEYASRIGNSSSGGGGGACPYSSERRQQIFVNYAYIEKIQNFVRKWRAEHAAAAAGR